MICLEVIVGFSFLETEIKIPQQTRTSVKLINQENISENFSGDKTNNLYDEIIDITMQIRKITKLSIFEILSGLLMGN